ncbi:hypothetical protein ACFB49_15070 [Sphingomonas sp. DBB INV C78]|uniref:DUF4169 family protein n=1 Tax=Sphingomonas sp. DBB INV C78 TaxID=3349434 RepID=UPI0036D2DB95
MGEIAQLEIVTAHMCAGVMCGIDLGVGGRHDRGMGEVINLRLARKAKARSDATAKAAENRAKHGRTKAQKAAEAVEQARLKAVLDGAERE